MAQKTLILIHRYYSFLRKSIPRCRRINRMLSNESLHSPAFSRSNSQASVDGASMEDFWREIESIKENSMGGQDEQTPAELKPVDGKVLDSFSCVLTCCLGMLSVVQSAGRTHPINSLTDEFSRIQHISHLLPLVYIY